MVGPDTYPAELTEYYINGRRVVVLNATTITGGETLTNYWPEVTADQLAGLADLVRSFRRLEAVNLSWIPNQREAHGGLQLPQEPDLPANIPAPKDLRQEIRRMTTPRRQLVP